MIVAGVDPGISGAIAILNEDGVQYVGDLPTHQILTGRKVRLELDLTTLRWLLTSQPIDHVVIERVASRPGQGVSSTFKFGYAAGEAYGLVVGLQMPCSFCLPLEWQRAVKVGPSSDAARQRATQLYPQSAIHLSRKKDGGRADAILIARYGLQLMSRPQAEVAE